MLEAEIGIGAAGITYRGRDHQGVAVAIKRFDLSRTRDPKRLALIDRECSILRQLRHLRIPRYIDHFIVGAGLRKRLFLVQGFVDGKDLDAWMAEHRFTEGEILDIVEKVLDVLEYLHGLSPPVLHRDVKPGNVIRETATGELFLVDFGSVQDELQGDLGGSTVAGTFGYMAPEQIGGDASPASDLYGLGVLAIHLATRREPSTMLDHANRLHWTQHTDLSAATRRFLDRMVARDPGERFRDVASARAGLHAARHGDAVTAPVGALPGSAPMSRAVWKNSRPLARIATGRSSGPTWRVRRPRTGDERELALEAIWSARQNGWLEPTDTIALDDRAEVALGGLDLEGFAVEVYGEEGRTLFRRAARGYATAQSKRVALTLLFVGLITALPAILRVRDMVHHPASNPPPAEAPAAPEVTKAPVPIYQFLPSWPKVVTGDPVVAEQPIECAMKAEVTPGGRVGTVMAPPGSSGCVGPFLNASLGASLSWSFEPAKTSDGTPSEGEYWMTYRFEPDGSVKLVPQEERGER